MAVTAFRDTVGYEFRAGRAVVVDSPVWCWNTEWYQYHIGHEPKSRRSLVGVVVSVLVNPLAWDVAFRSIVHTGSRQYYVGLGPLRLCLRVER